MSAFPHPGITISQATSAPQISQVRDLFLEYGESLGFSLCFQSFDKELAELPGDYAPPEGRLFLAAEGKMAAGCIALRGMEKDVCEMKRLYVRPVFRGKRVGYHLVQTVIDSAREIGYSRMRLDTVEPIMQDAVAIYRRFGFREIAPYRVNPIAGALYMELDLSTASFRR